MSALLRSESPCITAAMRAASRRLTMLYDEVMAPSGLRVTQYNILSEIERRLSDPPTITELAEILIMERSALGQTLRPLERDGLIEFKRDERDARSKTIALTFRGTKAVAWARGYWVQAHQLSERFFGDAALAELRMQLREIAKNPALSAAFEASSQSSAQLQATSLGGTS